MATYKEIQGLGVTQSSTAPTVLGELFYNTSLGRFQANKTGFPGSWASGGSLNTARNQVCQGADGIQTAAILAGGNTTTADVETYNGSAWTEVNNLNTGRNSTGLAGTTAAAVDFGGQTPGTANMGNTETWDGSSWTEVNDLNTARMRIGRAGTSTAGLGYGGGPPYKDETETWNGTTWTEVNDLNTAKVVFGTGTQTAALAAGGEIPASPWRTDNVEYWDGTNWTEGANLNTATNFNGVCGTQTSALSFGGSNPSVTTNTEAYDGTAWTEVSNLATARSEMGAAGSGATSGLGAAGNTAVTNTEEWSSPSVITKTVTTS